MNRKSNSMAPLALLVVLVIAAGFLLMAKPKRSEVANARVDLDSATADLLTTKQAITSMKASVDDPELKALLGRIPRGEQTPDFIDVISHEAVAANVRVSMLNFAAPTGSSLGAGSQYGILLAVNGPQAGVDSFLTALHAIERLTIVHRAGVSSVAPSLTPSSTEGALDSTNAVDPSDEISLSVELSIFTGQLSAPTQ
jgi:hypothetical protein